VPQTILAYTATNQLFFAMTPTGSTGVYDYNWHWYDAAGRRVITHVQNGSTWIPANGASPDSGTRNFYVYDGDDVTLTFVKQGTAWWVRARYLTGGLDDQVAGRFKGSPGLAAENLTLVADHSGTTLAAVKFDGTQELTVPVYSKNPWGMTDLFSLTAGQVNVETGFTGASQPNQTGGFVYLRNRWYDPKTGRFLTQDPIGLAGGVNLYSYAGNGPVSFSDPFGLCDELNNRNKGLSTTAPCDLILVIFAEASSENLRGMIAVGSVARNRVTDRSHEFRRRRTYERVIHQRNQFRGVGNRQWRAAERQMNGRQQLTGSDLRAFNMAIGVAEGIYNNSIQDNTAGSLWFATPGNMDKAVIECVNKTKKCEKVDIDGDLDRHEFVRYKKQ